MLISTCRNHLIKIKPAADVIWANGNKYSSYLFSYVDIDSSSFQYAILKDKKGHFLYGISMLEPKSCDSFVELIKDAYNKDFTYNILDNVTVFGKKGKIASGSIDIKNWRIELSCYEEGDIFMATALSGKKEYINKVEKRQKIECTTDNGTSINYQIDNKLKLLIDENNITMGETTLFNDDLIVVEKKEIVIKIDRNSGKLIIASKQNDSKLLGSCQKIGSEKKF